MLVELSVMEQRFQAVLAVVQDGETITEVARRVGVSRQAIHARIRRYQAIQSGALSKYVRESTRHQRPKSALRLPSCLSCCGAWVSLTSIARTESPH